MATRGRKPTAESLAGEAVVSLQAGPDELVAHDAWETRWALRMRMTLLETRKALLAGNVVRADALTAGALHDLDGWWQRDLIENRVHQEVRDAAGVVIRDCRLAERAGGGAA